MEFKQIIEQAYQAYLENKKTVLATIVQLEGSSYRREGSQMLLREDGQMTFALSGGCIEMEVFQAAQSIFAGSPAKMMAYDGLNRLGCEGLLYILLEPLTIDQQRHQQIHQLLESRETLKLRSYFLAEDSSEGQYGTTFQSTQWPETPLSASAHKLPMKALEQFQWEIQAPFKLFLFGSGHDVAAFSQVAKSLHWEISVVLCEQSPKTKADFPAANHFYRWPELEDQEDLWDHQTAVVVMSHNFEKDAAYVQALLPQPLCYLGMIGSLKRRDKLKDYLEIRGINPGLVENIYTPAGLNIGANQPEEIALSVIAEILAVKNTKSPYSLKEMKSPFIHLLN
ncbi:XdhC family protein [Persicobacter diffluens]|uniref:Xanthine dehydrogenase subunit A n=1 Tax=Persicobacter diffluens TaxID=981 RepID=A0AAN5AMW9_9BACT|nr:putative xanthine dehydrogenase subunit A [Persicobacter diffluens]